MPLSTRRALMGGSYDDRVLDTGPIAYFPMREISGTTCYCLTNPAMNGTYARDVATMTTGPGPDGGTAPNFDGANDYVDVQTPALAAAFNGLEWTVMIWAKVNAAAIWTDAASRYAAFFYANANNREGMGRSAANNTLQYILRANAEWDIINDAGHSQTGWMCLAHTSSDANDQHIAYFNGTQAGAIATPIGTWAGALATSIIGASSVVPAEVWHGGIARCALWARALGPGGIAELWPVL